MVTGNISPLNISVNDLEEGVNSLLIKRNPHWEAFMLIAEDRQIRQDGKMERRMW